MFPICVSDLLIETREFELVLGAMEPDGCKVPGIINQFKGSKVSL